MTTLPRPRPLATPAPLPSLADLAKREIRFSPVVVGAPDSPVRLFHQDRCCGIFARPALASHLISRLVCLVILFSVTVPVVAVASSGDGAYFSATSSSVPAVLKAIAVVEDWQGRRGKLGEVGPYQMMPATWASYSGTYDERAIQHLARLKRSMRARGVAPIPFNIALAWNCGLDRTAAGGAPPPSFSYARRVVAVLEAMQ